MIVQSQTQEGLPMPFNILKKKSSFFIACGLVFTLIIGIAAGYFSSHGITENGKFEAFAREVFRNEVSGSALTLHYSLAHPEKQGIQRKKASLGTVLTDMTNTYKLCQQYEDKLKAFRYSHLSTENQLTLDSMLLYSRKNLLEIIIFSRSLSAQAWGFRHSSLSFWLNMLFMKIGTFPII